MTHLSENTNKLAIHYTPNIDKISALKDVTVLILPACPQQQFGFPISNLKDIIDKVVLKLNENATFIIIGEHHDLVKANTHINTSLRYQLWIAMKRRVINEMNNYSLPMQHTGMLVYSKYENSLKHTKTRIKYTYCPACDKTTKDYGGKKHTYHEYGTLMSDVWRDIECDLKGDLTPIIERLSDIFGIPEYSTINIVDIRSSKLTRSALKYAASYDKKNNTLSKTINNKLLQGDCIEELKKIPSNSIDFAFADPPYNLKKKYLGYDDDMQVVEYFKWCDQWLTEMARVLRPGRTCAVLNIPLCAARHYLHMQKILKYQNWIVWEALSFPVRMIMPAHYTTLCFSKGNPRTLSDGNQRKNEHMIGSSFPILNVEPLAEGYCVRSQCISERKKQNLNDKGILTDLWWDIHRLKHNSRRVDHPCQLPPQLMYRLISLFTKPNEVVLDCFNGAGTTTLTAQQMGRNYVGIELSEKYNLIAQVRHEELSRGLDPFRKMERVLIAKNSPVPRLLKQKYKVPKKVLQLEVKRIASVIGRIPNRQDVRTLSKYPINYFDTYFTSWGEVCAAARTTGMTEFRKI